MNLVAPDPDVRLVLRDRFEARPLLTENETRFFHTLQQLSQNRCHIFVKPRLADFITSIGGKRGDMNRIEKKHVDFLICRQGDLAVMLGIELDDSSHNNPKSYKRDQFVNDLFAAAGIPLLRLPLDEAGDQEPIASQLSEAWLRRCHLLATGLPLPKEVLPVRKKRGWGWWKKAPPLEATISAV